MTIDTTRRGLLLGALACPVCLAAGAAFAADGPHWGYAGEHGPAQWGALGGDNAVCGAGREQSPVDLDGAIAAQHPEVVPSLRAGPLRIVNNGHTIQVNTPSGGHTMLGDKRFDLLQFHFHHPSEHVVAGSAFPLEVHLVHRAADGELAVLGVFFRPGAANPALAPVWAALPGSKGPEVVGTAMVDPAALLPGGKVFRYAGSLTTPPCTESVQWVVYETPATASDEQFARFAALFPNNARPVQPLGRRFLLRSS